MDAIPYVDSLVKEYLLFRGFTGSLRAFNKELSTDRGRGFQADQLCELVFRKLLPLDHASELMDVLDFLSKRVYSRLPASHEGVIRKLEVGASPPSRRLRSDSTHKGDVKTCLLLTGVHTASIHCQSSSSRENGCCSRLLLSVWGALAAANRVIRLAAVVCPPLSERTCTRHSLSGLLKRAC